MKTLHLYNFKCFQNIGVKLNQLTALLGVNGIGKSSVIQALLLLKSSIESKQSEKSFVSLNGPFGLQLGTSSGIINQNTNDNVIKIALCENDKCLVDVRYSINSSEENLGLEMHSLEIDPSFEDMKCLSFLCAERLGPRISQPLQRMDFLNVGIQGENTAQVIGSKGGREKVRPECMFEESKDPNLQTQVNLWLNFILPGVGIIANTDYQNLRASIKIENQFSSISPLLSTNIGFGISYVLPVITSGLIAPRNSILIVENPEAHLHPAAQSAIGEFLSMVARSGVMVVLETHSDHIISGIQIDAAKHPEFSNRITINNFSIDEHNNQPVVEDIDVESDGSLSKWPNGFLNQAQLDYIKLSRIQSCKHV